MNRKDYDFRNDTGTYQTGRTEPRKHHNGLIAFLITLVILLSGISTALSIMNLKLYWKLNTQQENPQVAFSRAEGMPLPTQEASHEESIALQEPLGIVGTIIPGVYQRYYKLPNGIYVTAIASGSEASDKGLVVGDIITRINNVTIRDDLSLDRFVENLEDGETVDLSLFRSGSEYTVTLIWNE